MIDFLNQLPEGIFKFLIRISLPLQNAYSSLVEVFSSKIYGFGTWEFTLLDVIFGSGLLFFIGYTVFKWVKP